ncbi:MAG: SRPBCC family protein [Deltaproteobacteria bacterium]|nr:SRPBCC family protein [Deltaproteobacteria bacterium]
MASVTRTILINAPIERVFAVITDFAAYPEFLSDVTSARVVRTDGDCQDVEFRLQLMTTIHYTLRMQLAPPQGVRWHLVQGQFMRSNDGSWALKTANGGTEATYTVDIGLGMLVPKMVTNALVEGNLPATLAAFKARAEAKVKTGRPRKTKGRQ